MMTGRGRMTVLAMAAAAVLVSACQTGSSAEPSPSGPDAQTPTAATRMSSMRWRLAVPSDEPDGTVVSSSVLEGWGDPGRVESANGGEVLVRSTADGSALRFPDYAAQAEPPLAVLVFDQVLGTPLDPQAQDFGFEVDLRLDPV